MGQNYTSESELESDLYQVFKEFIADNTTAFEEPTLQQTTESGKRSDLYIPSHTKESLVIEVKHPENEDYLLAKKNIKQARDYAEEYGHSTFALTNGEDLFLFDYNNEIDISEIDSYYLNVREFTFDELPKKVLGAVEELFDRGELPEQLDKDKIIGILRTFHHHTYPTYKKHIENLHGKDRKFRHQFEEWVEENGYTNLDEDEQIDTLAKQHTYALTNRLLFYKLLKDNDVGRQHDTILDDIDTSGSSVGLQQRVEQQFERVVENINYEPIFSIEDDIFNEIPRTKRTDEDFNQLLQNFKQFDLTEIDEDLIGQLYEELIPPSERKKLGQFYTPPSVAETIVRWTLGAESSGWDAPRVLDPACGSGTFPVEVYKEIDAKYDISHQEIIDNISVVDINRFPLHLTGINLTSRNITEPTNHIDSFHGSFFDYPEPEEKGKYDAVVGNPPYISSKQLYPDKEHFREHLKDYNPDGNKVPEYYRGTKKMRKSTDAYIYFITNALRYLKEGGRLGVIIPSKWMETKYGEDFQTFLLDNVKINSILSFSKQTFEDALVDTSVLLVEKCSVEKERSENNIDFISINSSVSPEKIVRAVEFDIDGMEDNKYNREKFDDYIITTVNQDFISSKNKLTPIYKSPLPILDIVSSDNIGKFSDYADITRENETGGSEFFFVSEQKKEEYGISDDVLTPAIKSLRNVDKEIIDSSDSDKYLLTISNVIDTDRINDPQSVKEELSLLGYDNVVEYIKWGEENNYNENKKCLQRDVWFDLEVKSPPILHPKFCRERVFTIINKDRLAPSQSLQCVFPENGGDEEIISAITNSYMYKIFLELWGRNEAGLLSFAIYEIKDMPFPKIESFDESEKEKLKQSYKNIISGNYTGLADEVILENMNIEEEIDINYLRNTQRKLLNRRVGGFEKDVLLTSNTNEEASVFEEHE